jgi:hypothetical protein
VSWLDNSEHCINHLVCAQRDHRVPPAERLKHLYRLLEEHYDLTGGDYYGRCTHRVREPRGDFKRATRLEEYPVTCAPYLTSIGVKLDFLEGSNNLSSDPMRDLIDDAFCHPTPSYSRYRAGPISTWEIDWNRPLPQVTHAYWEMMCVSWTRVCSCLYHFLNVYSSVLAQKASTNSPRRNPSLSRIAYFHNPLSLKEIFLDMTT